MLVVWGIEPETLSHWRVCLHNHYALFPAPQELFFVENVICDM